MDELKEIKMMLGKIMEKLGIPQMGGEQDFENMAPESQNQMMEKEFNANKEKSFGR